MKTVELYLYFRNPIVKEAYNYFNKQLSKYVYNNKYSIANLNNLIFEGIAELPLKNFSVSLTDSNSIYYRFSLRNNEYEFRLEVFFDYEADNENDIEAILHIYNKEVKEKSTYGSIEYLYGIILNLSYESPTVAIECYSLYIPQEENRPYSNELSPVFSAGKELQYY